MLKYATDIKEIGEILLVKYNDKSSRALDMRKYTNDWFNNTNDMIFEKYGFNYTPSMEMQNWYRNKTK